MTLRRRLQRFEEVKNALADEIVSGHFAPGDRLPSMRELCRHFNVALVTVQRAVQELKDEEWLVTSPGVGTAVADPLPPMARLVRQKSLRRAEKERARPASAHRFESGRHGELKCLITDEALLPLFEWAAREYADAYAPCSLRFEVEPLAGREDEDALRRLDADLALLPSYAVNRARKIGAICSSEGMIEQDAGAFREVIPALLNILTCDEKLWGVPVMANGPVLVADECLCRNFGIEPAALNSFDSFLVALETAVARGEEAGGARIFNLSFVRSLLGAAGHCFTDVTHAPELVARAEVRSILERLRALAAHPLVVVERFDHWDQTDLSQLAVRHQPVRLLCSDPMRGNGVAVLPIPSPGSGGQSMTVHAMCISAGTVHVFEAWEWAARLAEAPFQARLAQVACDLPVSGNAQVWSAFSRRVGERNAATLQGLLHEVSPVYGLGRFDVMRYLWEVLANEIARFISGQNDYARLVERVETKTARFIGQSENGVVSVTHSPRVETESRETTVSEKVGIV